MKHVIIELQQTKDNVYKGDMILMIKDLFGKCKDILKNTINKLKGHEKRTALAQIAEIYGRGGQTFRLFNSR